MKEVEAFWEKRNLGVACREIYIERDDEQESIKARLKRITEPYQVLFLPVERADMLIEIQNQGFQYIESNFDMVRSCAKGKEMPDAYRRVLKSTSCRLLFGQERDGLIERIRRDLVFDRDKVSIDPFFSLNDSAKRNYWRIMDYIAEGRDLRFYNVYYREKLIGFFLLEMKTDNVVEALLSGLYPECRETMLGSCIMGEQTREAMRLGAEVVWAGVSLNNFSCLKIYLSLGYEIGCANQIFIKHLREGKNV